MRSLKGTACVVLALLMGACETHHTVPVSMSAGGERVAAALQHWPAVAAGGGEIRRTFFVTVKGGNRRTTATGVLQYYGPRDFRLTAVNELGTVLFDGRVNWAGVTVLRQAPGMDKGMVEQTLQDLSRAFSPPPDLKGLIADRGGEGKLTYVLRKKLSDTRRYTWTFDEAGLLRTTEIDMGLFDALRVDYRSYNSRGWPEELEVARPARLFDLVLSFTDNNVVQGDWRGNAQ